MKTLTLEDWKTIKPDTIFDNGMTVDRDGLEMKWLAVKACTYGVDWAIYTGEPNETLSHIRRWGRKISNKERIRELVKCDDAFFDLYRY